MLVNRLSKSKEYLDTVNFLCKYTSRCLQSPHFPRLNLKPCSFEPVDWGGITCKGEDILVQVDWRVGEFRKLKNYMSAYPIFAYHDYVDFRVIGCIEPNFSPYLHSAFVNCLSKNKEYLNIVNDFIEIYESMTATSLFRIILNSSSIISL